MHRLIVALALVGALVAAGCGSGSSSSSSGSSASTTATGAPSADHTQMKTGVFPLDLFTAGAAGGLFKHGNVKTVTIDSGPAALPLLQSGAIDAVSGIAAVPLATALATGIDYKIVWITNSQDPMRLVAKVGSAASLKGKAVGLPIGSIAHFFFERYLAANGMKPSDVQELDVAPPSMLASFQRGAIQAAYAWAPFWTQLKSAGGTVLDSQTAKEFLVVRSDFVKQHPGAVQAVVCDLANIHGQFERDPAPLYQLLSKTTQQPVRALEQLYPQTNAGPSKQANPQMLGTPGGAPSQAATLLHDAALWLKSKGQVPSAPSLAAFQGLFMPQFAQAAESGKCA